LYPPPLLPLCSTLVIRINGTGGQFNSDSDIDDSILAPDPDNGGALQTSPVLIGGRVRVLMRVTGVVTPPSIRVADSGTVLTKDLLGVVDGIQDFTLTALNAGEVLGASLSAAAVDITGPTAPFTLLNYWGLTPSTSTQVSTKEKPLWTPAEATPGVRTNSTLEFRCTGGVPINGSIGMQLPIDAGWALASEPVVTVVSPEYAPGYGPLFNHSDVDVGRLYVTAQWDKASAQIRFRLGAHGLPTAPLLPDPPTLGGVIINGKTSIVGSGSGALPVVLEEGITVVLVIGNITTPPSVRAQAAALSMTSVYSALATPRSSLAAVALQAFNGFGSPAHELGLVRDGLVRDVLPGLVDGPSASTIAALTAGQLGIHGWEGTEWGGQLDAWGHASYDEGVGNMAWTDGLLDTLDAVPTVDAMLPMSGPFSDEDNDMSQGERAQQLRIRAIEYNNSLWGSRALLWNSSSTSIRSHYGSKAVIAALSAEEEERAPDAAAAAVFPAADLAGLAPLSYAGWVPLDMSTVGGGSGVGPGRLTTVLVSLSTRGILPSNGSIHVRVPRTGWCVPDSVTGDCTAGRLEDVRVTLGMGFCPGTHGIKATAVWNSSSEIVAITVAALGEVVQGGLWRPTCDGSRSNYTTPSVNGIGATNSSGVVTEATVGTEASGGFMVDITSPDPYCLTGTNWTNATQEELEYYHRMDEQLRSCEESGSQYGGVWYEQGSPTKVAAPQHTKLTLLLHGLRTPPSIRPPAAAVVATRDEWSQHDDGDGLDTVEGLYSALSSRQQAEALRLELMGPSPLLIDWSRYLPVAPIESSTLPPRSPDWGSARRLDWSHHVEYNDPLSQKAHQDFTLEELDVRYNCSGCGAYCRAKCKAGGCLKFMCDPFVRNMTSTGRLEFTQGGRLPTGGRLLLEMREGWHFVSNSPPIIIRYSLREHSTSSYTNDPTGKSDVTFD
jgi:hypothetical protein